MAGIPNIPGMMKQFQKMQEKMAAVQQELEGRTVAANGEGELLPT
jgi:DNA-binding protein YbaB